MICKRCDHTEHADRCMVSLGLPGDYQPCGCQPGAVELLWPDQIREQFFGIDPNAHV